jgi:diguanylate cyclase (GGDEF)-like protein
MHGLGSMDTRLFKAQRGPLSHVAGRSRLLSLSTVLLVFAMVATAIAGFAHVTTQQQMLIGIREQTREIQAVRRALTQADADVMYFVQGDRSRLASYFGSIEVLSGHGGVVLSRLDLQAGSETETPVPVVEVIEELKSTWAKAIELTTDGNVPAAEALLVEKRTGDVVASIGAGIETLLARTNTRLPVHEDRIRIGTLLVLLLQVGGGTLAILGLVYAFRSGNREAEGRASAVQSADSSREQVARLFDMADVLQSAADHVDANAVLKATASDLIPGLAGALYVFNNSRDRLVLSSEWGRSDGTKLPDTINPNACWAVKRGKPHTNRADGGKLCCEHHHDNGAVLEIPMIARGEIVGLFQLFAEGAEAEARLEEVTAIGSALADGMSLALANMALREKLKNQALRDPLTGLYNRRYMEDTLQRFVRLAEREAREISVVMVDLDHFKRLNDERGHAFGDQVLRDAAMALVGSLRETDVVCRYGGEELVVILPDCPVERAADKAEVLRLRIAELSNSHGAEISASFGVASVPHTSQSVADLLAAADAALYKAKQNGRNQVVTAPLRPFRLDRAPETPRLVEDVPREAAE